MSTHSRSRALLVVTSAIGLVVACARQHKDAPGLAGSAAPTSAVGAGQGGGLGNTANTANPPEQDAHMGAKAIVALEPVPDSDSMLAGSGTFTQTASGVDLELHVRGCERGALYPVFIQAGSDCSAASLLGAHWDSPRGEGIGTIMCTGGSGGGRTYHTRLKGDTKPWTIGKPAASNLLQHAVVYYDPNTAQPLACGTIMPAPDVEQVPDEVKKTGPKVETRAVIAGSCLFKMIVRDNTQECPKPTELTKCATDHCELDPCVAACTDYLACLDQAGGEPCDSAVTCETTAACSECQGKVVTCVFGFCPEVIACAAPVTPGGPCSQLEACCAMQGDGAAQCLDTVHLLERFSGDPSCIGAMRDWDTTAHLKVPCKFE